MKNAISAIVVNYNAGDLLPQAVDALRTCPIVSEIVVVDNASTDSSLAAIENLAQGTMLRNARNLGFSAACNQGIGVATSDYLLFLNPDCTFAPGTLQLILDSMCHDDDVGMAGRLLVNADGSEQPGSRRVIPTLWRSFVRVFGLHRFHTRWPRLFPTLTCIISPCPHNPLKRRHFLAHACWSSARP